MDRGDVTGAPGVRRLRRSRPAGKAAGDTDRGRGHAGRAHGRAAPDRLRPGRGASRPVARDTAGTRVAAALAGEDRAHGGVLPVRWPLRRTGGGAGGPDTAGAPADGVGRARCLHRRDRRGAGRQPRLAVDGPRGSRRAVGGGPLARALCGGRRGHPCGPERRRRMRRGPPPGGGGAAGAPVRRAGGHRARPHPRPPGRRRAPVAGRRALGRAPRTGIRPRWGPLVPMGPGDGAARAASALADVVHRRGAA